MEKEEIAQIFEDFLNEKGMWYAFTEWLDNKGYKLSELGLTE